ncbi:MAG: AraC family transcriptional regulator [Pseudomonadales bacterium]|nr:AraC family transcriptional regulator [Pseudomonadales bacterium]
MMYQTKSIAYEAVKDVLNAFGTKQIDIASLVSDINGTPKYRETPSSRLAVSTVSKLTKRVVKTFQDESLGVARTPLLPGTYNMLFHTTISCKTLGEAYLRSSKYLGLHDCGLMPNISISENQSEIILEINTPESQNETYNGYLLFFMVALHRWSCWLTKTNINVIGAGFTLEEPSYSKDITTIFGNNLQFSHEKNFIILEKSSLDLEIAQTPYSLEHFTENIPGVFFEAPNFYDGFSGKVSSFIKNTNFSEHYTFDDIADSLNMTPHTLRRRLKSEGTTYSELKDLMRKETAIFYLTKTDASIKYITFKVGFTEPCIFARAFRLWTGKSPSEYRLEHDHLSHR